MKSVKLMIKSNDLKNKKKNWISSLLLILSHIQSPVVTWLREATQSTKIKKLKAHRIQTTDIHTLNANKTLKKGLQTDIKDNKKEIKFEPS